MKRPIAVLLALLLALAFAGHGTAAEPSTTKAPRLSAQKPPTKPHEPRVKSGGAAAAQGDSKEGDKSGGGQVGRKVEKKEEEKKSDPKD